MLKMLPHQNIAQLRAAHVMYSCQMPAGHVQHPTNGATIWLMD